MSIFLSLVMIGQAVLLLLLYQCWKNRLHVPLYTISYCEVYFQQSIFYEYLSPVIIECAIIIIVQYRISQSTLAIVNCNDDDLACGREHASHWMCSQFHQSNVLQYLLCPFYTMTATNTHCCCLFLYTLLDLLIDDIALYM